MGIVANTLALAILLHIRKLVSLLDLRWGELGKATLTAAAAGLLSYRVAGVATTGASRVADVMSLTLAAITWTGAVAAGLWLTRSELPGALRRREGTAYPRVAESQADELTRGIEP